jgi:hypothetical protein
VRCWGQPSGYDGVDGGVAPPAWPWLCHVSSDRPGAVSPRPGPRGTCPSLIRSVLHHGAKSTGGSEFPRGRYESGAEPAAAAVLGLVRPHPSPWASGEVRSMHRRTVGSGRCVAPPAAVTCVDGRGVPRRVSKSSSFGPQVTCPCAPEQRRRWLRRSVVEGFTCGRMSRMTIVPCRVDVWGRAGHVAQYLLGSGLEWLPLWGADSPSRTVEQPDPSRPPPACTRRPGPGHVAAIPVCGSR